MASAEPQTWHYGVVARWWAEFNLDGPEIDYFRPFVEAGQPALDAACGAGRILIPYRRAGLDVDGCDISPDMLALCRERAEREGAGALNLYAQPLHELDLPRRYQTIFVCGGFGLGADRHRDFEALRRLHAHLDDGGVLLLDNEVPYSPSHWWPYWLKRERPRLPRPWPEEGQQRTATDGTRYELRSRLTDIDALAQTVTLEMRARMSRNGETFADEHRLLNMTLYFTHELLLMLRQTGFREVEVRAGYADRAPTRDDDFVVFIAKK